VLLKGGERKQCGARKTHLAKIHQDSPLPVD
jgi:hypothetical protein